MDLYSNQLYMEDVRFVSAMDFPWERIYNKGILISGATGMIGSFLIDVLMEKNILSGANCAVYALSRDEKKAEERFCRYNGNPLLKIIRHDVNERFDTESLTGRADYVLHLASNTHPVQYSTDPIGTIMTNVIGLQHMLDIAAYNHASRFIFASSNEIYGENRGDTELFSEEYCGYINSNTMRAGYPESKRCGEALCQAYRAQKGMDVVVARLTRTYGPSMLMSDTKAVSQFIKKAVSGQDIVLKSAGNQFYSYQYVADSVSGLLTCLFFGENGEAYNIADEHSDIMLKDLAAMIAQANGRKVVFEIPDVIEAAGYSKATKARLDGRKLRQLGWNPGYDIRTGIERTILILKAERNTAEE